MFEKSFPGSTGDPPVPSGDSPDGTGATVRANQNFLPFLAAVRLLDKFLSRRLSEPGAILIYYLAAGSLGLLFEWFLMGLAPWGSPQAPLLAMVVLQLGMFSFWGGVALAPRLLLDAREVVSRVRKSCRLFLICGMAIICLVALAIPNEARFLATIASVLITFLGLNFFCLQYVRVVRKPADASATMPMRKDEWSKRGMQHVEPGMERLITDD